MTDPLLHNKAQDERWKVCHEEILAAVTRLLAAEGAGALTMQRIAQEAGFSVGFLYKHFTGKNDLLAEILDRHMEYAQTVTKTITVESAGSPLRALRTRLDFLTQQLMDNKDLLPTLLSVAESYPERVKRREAPMRAQEIELFDQAMKAGEIRIDDPVYVAAAYHGMVWGMIQFWNQSHQLDKICTIPQLVDRLLLQPMQRHPALPRKDDPRDQNA